MRWFGHLHRILSSIPARGVYDLNPNIHCWKRPRGRPKTRWADSIKHHFNSAGLDTTTAAQMAFDRPQWNAFASGLPTLEPDKALKSSKSSKSLCGVAGLVETFPYLTPIGPFLPNLPVFPIPSDIVFLRFGNCADVFRLISSFNIQIETA